jgi:hypothetical protein
VISLSQKKFEEEEEEEKGNIFLTLFFAMS